MLYVINPVFSNTIGKLSSLILFSFCYVGKSRLRLNSLTLSNGIMQVCNKHIISLDAWSEVNIYSSCLRVCLNPLTTGCCG